MDGWADRPPAAPLPGRERVAVRHGERGVVWRRRPWPDPRGGPCGWRCTAGSRRTVRSERGRWLRRPERGGPRQLATTTLSYPRANSSETRRGAVPAPTGHPWSNAMKAPGLRTWRPWRVSLWTGGGCLRTDGPRRGPRSPLAPPTAGTQAQPRGQARFAREACPCPAKPSESSPLGQQTGWPSCVVHALGSPEREFPARRKRCTKPGLGTARSGSPCLGALPAVASVRLARDRVRGGAGAMNGLLFGRGSGGWCGVAAHDRTQEAGHADGGAQPDLAGPSGARGNDGSAGRSVEDPGSRRPPLYRTPGRAPPRRDAQPCPHRPATLGATP